MNRSFGFAIIAGLILGTFIAIGLSFTNASLGWFGNVLIMLMVATLYVLWVYHNTPTQHMTAVFLFGTWRWHMGPEGNGFTEGLNAVPLGYPFVILEDKFSGERTETFEQTQAYTADNVVAMLSGTYQVYMYDIYETYNIGPPSGKEEPKDALKSVNSAILKHIRTAPESFTAVELISQEAGISGKSKVAKEAYEKAHAELEGPDAKWGYQISPMLQINHISLPGEYDTALRKVSQETIEGDAEVVQVRRRIQQIEMFKNSGITPDLAAALAQVEVEKPGATVTTFNVPGLEKGLDKTVDAIKTWLTGR
ncbi:MAG: SPFH domain-containing protein [Patescibacteria group bacterium]